MLESEACRDSDPAARDKLAALAESAALVRSAFDEVMHEPVPDRLIAGAGGERVAVEPSVKIVPFRRGQRTGGAPAARSWWLGLPLAASLFGLLLGGAVAYLSVAKLLPGDIGAKQPPVALATADSLSLANAVGYFKLAASAGDAPLVYVPATCHAREAWQKSRQSLP